LGVLEFDRERDFERDLEDFESDEDDDDEVDEEDDDELRESFLAFLFSTERDLDLKFN
jgi:hypothetical protein